MVSAIRPTGKYADIQFYGILTYSWTTIYVDSIQIKPISFNSELNSPNDTDIYV
jgi:hypothetical protein